MIDIEQTRAALERAMNILHTHGYVDTPSDLLTLYDALGRAEKWQTSGLGRVLVIPLDAADKETT